jgi:hypothetical protein
MKRMIFLTLVLVLLGTAGTAFADPQRVTQDPDPVTLGDVWWFYYPFDEPDLRVDAYLYRPSTLVWDETLEEFVSEWPFAGGPAYGTYWYPDFESRQRRMNLSGHAPDPDDPDPVYLFTDAFGYYYAEFMMPRDEVWFPCGFPLKWKCNYAISPVETEYHSPVQMVYPDGLEWPWAADPQDTVSPLEVYLIDENGDGYIIPFEVTGMYWILSDLNLP